MVGIRETVKRGPGVGVRREKAQRDTERQNSRQGEEKKTVGEQAAGGLDCEEGSGGGGV